MSKIETQQIVDEDIETDDNDTDFTTSSTENDVVNVASEKEDRFDFDSNTIILGIQILPATTNDLRQVLITAGIKIQNWYQFTYLLPFLLFSSLVFSSSFVFYPFGTLRERVFVV